MNKKLTLALVAVLALAFSCAKQSVMEPQNSAPEIQADRWTVVPVEGVPSTLPGKHTATADYASESKSHFTWNSGKTHATVEWTAGDAFYMFGYVGKSASYVPYMTTSSGASVDFETDYTMEAEYLANGLHCIYPYSSFVGLGTVTGIDGLVYRVRVPHEQTARAGSVDEGANLSYALVATQDEDFHFKNFVSIVKFTLSGDIVSQVKQVTFRGVSDLAGDVVLYPSGGVPYILSNVRYTVDVRYRSVTLSGDFVAGQDYYIAVAPSVQDGFSMVFANSDGSQKITKISSKSLSLNRSRITDLGTIALGDSFDAPVSLTPYIQHDPSHSQYATIAVIPDGYTAGEMDQYELDAKAGIDALFATEPYKTYKEYFNVWILKVASNESGARISDGTTAEQNRDCYFRSTWGKASYDNMQASADRVFSFVEDNCPDVVDGSHNINNVPVLIIINDTRYGGIAWNYSNGATYCMVPTTSGTLGWAYASTEAASVTAVPGDTRTVTPEEKAEMGTNSGNWHNTLVHEFGGHSIGKLADEYWYGSYKESVTEIAQHSWPVPMSLNISATSDAAEVPWAELFESGNVAKMAGKSDKYAARIGVFQGGDVSMFNRWRSERISVMIDNRFYFSTWQRYLVANRIMTLAGLSSLSVSEFLDNDVMMDPLRDGGSPVMLPEGVSNAVPPRQVPMLPPPRWAEDWK